jgi:hypothetical protein
MRTQHRLEGTVRISSFPNGIPLPPTRVLPNEFECHLCFTVRKIRKPSDWSKHVLDDVKLFTCSWEQCKEQKPFTRKSDWIRHENEKHRHLEWWVCQVDECMHTCYRKDDFVQHLIREYKLPEPKQRTKVAIKRDRATEIVWRMVDRCHHGTLARPDGMFTFLYKVIIHRQRLYYCGPSNRSKVSRLLSALSIWRFWHRVSIPVGEILADILFSPFSGTTC